MTRCAQGGFTLVELAVAAAVGALALAALTGFAIAAQAALEADPAAADAQQRLRAAAVVLREAVDDAGSGFVLDPDAGPGHALPSLVPAAPTAGAWPGAPAAGVLTSLASTAGAARGRVAADVPAGAALLPLVPPPFCAAGCGFASGDTVIVYDEQGAAALARLRRVDPPLVLVLEAPVPRAFAAGAWAAQVEVVTLATRASADGRQLTRARGLGAANPVVDHVRQFDVTWWGRGAAPAVQPALDGTPGRTTAGPLPPHGRALPGGAWPAGENCVFAGDGAGGWVARVPPLGAGLVALPLAELQDGPWCPDAAAPDRWDVDLLRVRQVRVALTVDAAAEGLRAPAPGLPGGWARRLVPPVRAELVLEPGRWRGEAW